LAMAATQDSCEDNIALGPGPRPALAGPPTRLPDVTAVDVDAAAIEHSYRKLSETAARVFRLLPVNPGPDVSTGAVAVLADLPVSEIRRFLGPRPSGPDPGCS
jgi:hypothetical protein